MLEQVHSSGRRQILIAAQATRGRVNSGSNREPADDSGSGTWSGWQAK